MNAEANTVEDQNIDRRVRKTKKQLRQALMDLMSEKPSKSISVRELAERADINRGTFYIHYKDVGDLLQRLEDEMAERLILVCKKYAYANTEVNAFPYLTELYRFAQDNADLCLVLLGPNGDRAYTDLFHSSQLLPPGFPVPVLHRQLRSAGSLLFLYRLRQPDADAGLAVRRHEGVSGGNGGSGRCHHHGRRPGDVMYLNMQKGGHTAAFYTFCR